MAKFLKIDAVAKAVMGLVTERVRNADTFPQVYFLPELIYRSALSVSGGDKKVALEVMRSNSKLHGFAQLQEEILDLIDAVTNDTSSAYVDKDISLSSDSILTPIMIDGVKFECVMLRTITVYELPKFEDGAFFGTLPLLTLEELEEESQTAQPSSVKKRVKLNKLPKRDKIVRLPKADASLDMRGME